MDSKSSAKRDKGRWRSLGRGRGGRGGHGGRKWNKDKREGSFHKSREVEEQPDRGSRHNWNQSNKRFTHSRQAFSYSNLIPEKDLGITEYISSTERMLGILKDKTSDFIVHEIDCDGNIVKLTDLKAPAEDFPEPDAEVEEDNTIIPSEKWQAIKDLIQKGAADPPSEVTLEVTNLDKETRRKMHEVIKKTFGRTLQSNTDERDGKKFMIIKKGSDNRGRWTRGKDMQYLHFVLYKQGVDTSEAVNKISYKLGFKPSNLNFAGTKDKRACTSQRMSLWHGEPKRLRQLKLRNIWIGNYEFKNHSMQLGQLKGNIFTIALREIDGKEEDINETMTSLRDRGFINYFGTQRFGTNKDAPTHAIGKALLQGNWEKAVSLILHPRSDKYSLLDALKSWQKEKNAGKALSLIEGFFSSSVEATLLRGLAKSGKNDYLKALHSLPRNLRLLYLHAYQSFIWNRVASRRIRQFGLKTLPGDLVLVDDSTTDHEDVIDNVAVEEADSEVERPSENSGNSDRGATDEATPKEEIEKNESEEKTEEKAEEQDSTASKVRVISAEEAEKTPIEKIVLPTPGFKATLPDNVLKEWYVEFLAEDGLTIESLRQKSKEYSVGGSYRHFVAKPSQIEWKILHYKVADATLLLSDACLLLGKSELQDEPEGPFRALIIKMSLDTSMYATMALREIVDFQNAHQKRQNERSRIKNEEASEESLTSVKTRNEISEVPDQAPGSMKVNNERSESSEIKKRTSDGTTELAENGKDAAMDIDENDKATVKRTNDSPVNSGEEEPPHKKAKEELPTESTTVSGDQLAKVEDET